MQSAGDDVPQLGYRQWQVLYQELLGEIATIVGRLERLQKDAPQAESLAKMIGELNKLTDESNGQIEQLVKLALRITGTLDQFKQHNVDFVSVHKRTLDAMNSQLRTIGQHEQKMLLDDMRQQLNSSVQEHLAQIRTRYMVSGFIGLLVFVSGIVVGKMV